MPSFTVIITTHDRAGLLGRAIRSAQAQDGVDVQTIVVADKACRATQEIVSSLLTGADLYVQRSGLPGPAESRNLGIGLATGDHVLFLDDDDSLSPGFLRRAGGDADGRSVLFSDFSAVLERLDEGGPVAIGIERRSLADRQIDDLYVKNFIPLSCLVYPRSALLGHRFDPSLVLNEDWDFILGVLAETTFRHVSIDGPVIHTRVAADNRGRTNDHLLVPTYLQIYAHRRAPTEEAREARRALFRSVGLDAALLPA